VEVVAYGFDKCLVERVGVFGPLQLGIDGSYAIEDGVLLVLLPEVGHLTGIEHIIYVFEEALIHDLRVREEEAQRGLIYSTSLHELFDEVMEVLHSIVLLDFN
jgi:hypothetical protein